MSIPVVMPQMGESIAEGTIVRWIKKVGDTVDRDEPLFEISTDKVDAEIPAPAAGVLTEIKVKEGETVAVNSVVATIGDAMEQGPSREALVEADEPAATLPPKKAPTPHKPNGREAPAPAAPSHEEGRRQKSSPLVRRIARDNNVDVSVIQGSGLGGRVTKHDILGYLETGTRDSGAAAGDSGPSVAEPRTPDPGSRIPNPESRIPDPGRVQIEPLSVMRKKIAEHMVMSQRTSAHVHSVFHVNFSTVDRIRQQKKAEYEQLGAKLTYMAFISKAVIAALRRFPIVNASLDGDNVVYKKDINLGIAVALESGLIVPVIKHADEKNLLGLSRSIADLADRARAKQLKPDEVQGGTFTITNPGQFGSQFGLPIINQPQVAILGIGTIEKRPVVVDDAIAIRTMAYLTLGYDHRLVDGATGDQFMSEVKQQIEQFDINQA
ncbi:MAG TPA: dihydrolipoamide acetyltransferase family protein [Vicinamibacterales bacterium]|nr:dihydrolipoamide acetyltransferase family protein [Vicinamibacterales bacterium]